MNFTSKLNETAGNFHLVHLARTNELKRMYTFEINIRGKYKSMKECSFLALESKQNELHRYVSILSNLSKVNRDVTVTYNTFKPSYLLFK